MSTDLDTEVKKRVREEEDTDRKGESPANPTLFVHITVTYTEDPYAALTFLIPKDEFENDVFLKGRILGKMRDDINVAVKMMIPPHS